MKEGEELINQQREEEKRKEKVVCVRAEGNTEMKGRGRGKRTEGLLFLTFRLYLRIWVRMG